MCLILIAWQYTADCPLVIAANRDEAYARPSAPAAAWSDGSGIIAGQDTRAGGTWLGTAADGRFAAVTNFHLPGAPAGRRSRGALPVAFLTGNCSPPAYLARVATRAADYGPFCLLVGNRDALWWYSSHGAAPAPVLPGIHALGNGLLDEDRPRVQHGMRRLASYLHRTDPEADALLELLGETASPPDTGLPWQSLRLIGQEYGTRCSTVLIRRPEGATEFVERSLVPAPGCVRLVVAP